MAERANKCYRSYDKNIIRKDGTAKKRHIDSPNVELKKVQKNINSTILCPAVEMLPEYIHGSRRGKGIATNARMHVGKEAILSLDIQNCFPSIDARRIYYIYRNLLHCSNQVASVLVRLTTKDGVLPQGCPTSANLCNLALAHMLERMNENGKSLGLDMSHYIDDIFYSGRYVSVHGILPSALREIGKAGFRPNKKKIHISKNGNSLRIAGVTVNKKIGVGRTRIRRVERKILRVTARDKRDYDTVMQQRKAKAQTGQEIYIETCKIERLLGEISHVISINKQQGYRLKKKLDKKLHSLEK